MKIIYKAAVILTAAAIAGRALALPVRSEGQVDFWVDGAAFAGDGGRTWQEIYWGFSPIQLKPDGEPGRRLARFRTEISLIDSAGRSKLREDWKTTAPMPDSALAVQRSIMHIDQLAVPDLETGRYRLEMSITDLVSGRQGKVSTELEVPGFGGTRISVSQVQLAATITSDTTPSRFRKGGLVVRPNPCRVFGDATNNRLFYYLEVYNPDKAASLRVVYGSSNEPTLRVVETRPLSGEKGTIVHYGGLLLDDLENGYYRLWVQIVDAEGRMLAFPHVNFKVEKDLLQILPQQRQIMEEQAILEKEGGEYYDKIDLIATQAELAAYAKLSPAGRKEFLRQFWKRRDPNPETPANEALREHRSRYQKADADFREQGRAGSETDRGKMYIKYGPPDEVEKKLLEAETHDVLIWKYQNGQILIFRDRLGVGRFEMVYDKMNPQRSDPRFQSLLNQ